MLRFALPLLLLSIGCAPETNAQTDTDSGFTSLVNPFVGTDGTGHTFPGASLPFGMVQPSPDNQHTGWDYTAGYQYRDPQILGFSQSHISGAGIPELGDVLLLPFTSDDRIASGATYDKSTESARPGYYAVTLKEDDIAVELTASQRVALHRYTFPTGGRVRVLADLQHGLTFGERDRVLRSQVSTDEYTISGSVWSSNWVEREMHFATTFDHPIASVDELPRAPGEEASRYVLAFDLRDGAVLSVRTALSTVDVDGARGNLDDVPNFDFDAVAARADATWNDLLGRVRIEADDETRRMFYTALYHALLHPSDIADRDGRVRGPTGDVAQAPGGVYYSTLSLWDTFRAAHPLYALVVPERVDGFAGTMLAHHDAQGYLPLWTAWGRETHTMIGNPALPVLADAHARGFTGFDGQTALDAMTSSSTRPHHNSPWDVYLEQGYYPYDRVEGEAVSKTLEAGIGDASVAALARRLGDDQTADAFERRSAFYRNLFDEETGFFRGRAADGSWRTPFDPLEATSPLNNPGDFTEANAWQYLWTPALHDPRGLVDLLGGSTAFTRRLDDFFSIEGNGEAKFLGQEALIGQYAHGNEPSHHVAWLYAFSDTPQRGHELVRRIADSFYADRPDGIIGNDDCGQMSAWYVFASLGFYPVTPLDGTFVLGRPLVSRAEIDLGEGRTLVVTSDDPTGTRLLTRVLLDGEPFDGPTISHAALTGARSLHFASDAR